jgi:DNA-binding Xre family transcriptional regulator
MFTSNVKALMKKKKITVRGMVETTGISSATINRARQDEGIAECRLSTLGRIASSIGIPVKKLFDGEYEPGENGEQ